MVLFALTELAAEIGIWTLRKTLSWTGRGIWWGVQRVRGAPPAPPSLEEQVKILQETVAKQQEELNRLYSCAPGGASDAAGAFGAEGPEVAGLEEGAVAP
jgi:hypothetical protein